MPKAEKEHQCDHCKKIFQRKGDLKRHEKLHTGEKPHVCSDCGKAFAQFTGLKTHLNVHTGAKPHGCSQCGARFGDPSSCARHKRETHLYPEGYQCFMRGCRTRIKRRSAFVKHLREKHGLDMDNMSIEEAAAAAAAAGMVPFDVPKAATPPPDYGTAAQQPIYEGEALPTFPSDVVPKEEAYTPPSVVTPPPSIIDVVSSSEGYTWSSGDFIDNGTLGTGIACVSAQPPIMGVDYYFSPHFSNHPPAYYEQPWSGTSIPGHSHSVAPADIFNSSRSHRASGTDYNLTYDPNVCGDYNSPQLTSSRDVPDMHAYMTSPPPPMTSLPNYHFT